MNTPKFPILILFFLFLSVVSGCSHLAQNTVIENEIQTKYRQGPGEFKKIKYDLLTFQSRQQEEKFPLLVAFHGTGDNGPHYLGIWRREAERRRIMVLAPTLDVIDMNALFRMVELTVQSYPIDLDRIFVAGASSGAFLARLMVIERPSLWKKAVFVASPNDQWSSKISLKDLPPVLFVHGGRDNQFKFPSTVKRIEILKKKGLQAELKAYPHAGHEQKAEWSPAIFDWLLKES